MELSLTSCSFQCIENLQSETSSHSCYGRSSLSNDPRYESHYTILRDNTLYAYMVPHCFQVFSNVGKSEEGILQKRWNYHKIDDKL